MPSPPSLLFKIASEAWEFEQIHRLNYQTFVDEIPQHQQNTDHKLIDKFHTENTYVICVSDKTILAMIALRESILEYRLLAVKREHRNTAIFTGIMKKSFDLAMKGGYDIAVISGTTLQSRLYKHLGFKPFAAPVGELNALYQPMHIDMNGAIKLRKQSQALQTK